MEESYAHLQRGAVQSVSGTVDDIYEQIRLSVQSAGTRRIQSATTRTVKVILGLLGVVVLVALVVAVVTLVLYQDKISSLEEMVHKLQDDQTKAPGKDLPLPSTPTPSIESPSETSLTSCAAIRSSHPSAPSGLYTIHIGGRVPGREVWCDMVTDGGGWTRFQRRQDGTVRFNNRTWSEYRSGFGSADTESWLGNDDLHTLTSAQPSELRVDLWDWDGDHRYATFSSFSVGSEITKYTLHVSGYNGTAGDSLTSHNNLPFSTIDQDHDTWDGGNCAAIRGGGWWFRGCAHSSLNGRYYSRGVSVPRQVGVYWYHWRGDYYSLKAASMMTRPRQ